MIEKLTGPSLNVVAIVAIFAISGVAFSPLIGYVYVIVESMINILTLLGPSCSVVTFITNGLYSMILLFSGLFFYNKFIKS